eukprot:TRINITY_DN9299_c0_g1_i2.p1 TRINITY_DN9299_c0_g1~~TRINITY_DN9299_c0_g1_i2.p1  ORF type:complete len:246 (-),score=36.33 TRINITY_DN9299_c0_g1_i2:184-921(-)
MAPKWAPRSSSVSRANSSQHSAVFASQQASLQTSSGARGGRAICGCGKPTWNGLWNELCSRSCDGPKVVPSSSVAASGARALPTADARRDGMFSQALREPQLKPGLGALASGAENPADMAAYQALVSKQQDKLGGITRELHTSKRKVTHWAWWVFPTEKAGDADPDGTRVTRTTAAMLIKRTGISQDWRRVLELICDLVEDRGTQVLPAIDHSRVRYFIDFWSSLDASPDWMISICNRLGRFRWV